MSSVTLAGVACSLLVVPLVAQPGSAAQSGSAAPAGAASAATPSAADPAAPGLAGSGQPPSTGDGSLPGGPGQPGPTFTLLTGDQVRLVTASDGSTTGEVVLDAGPQGDVSFRQVSSEWFALTSDAVRLIGKGRVDRDLFNLTRLGEYRYDDGHTSQLPVIATHDKAAARQPAPRGAKRKRVLKPINGQALAVEKRSAARAWADLTRAGGSKKVWLDGKVKASLDVSASSVGAPAAWAAGLTGKGVKIAVLDTGIDTAHPDFAGRIVAQRRFVPGDVTNVEDGYGHGTHVASTAAGTGAASNGKYRGIAPDAHLVVGKVLDDNGWGLDSEIIAGMEWAAGQGAKVVNLSIGGPPTDGTDPLSQALNQISASSGALFVVAAGNRGNHSNDGPFLIDTPGAADAALTVANVTKQAPFGLDRYSSAGPRMGDRRIKPEIAAPGSDIIAAQPGGGYQPMSGTSMATPHVAGGAALLAGAHPEWTREQLRDALVSTADPLRSVRIRDTGNGVLDLAQATKDGLVATGTLNLGMVKHPQPATVSGPITLRNNGTQPIKADLNASVHVMSKNLDEQTALPATGAVTMTPTTVDLAPGASTTVQVTVRLDQLGYGTHYAYVAASSGGAVVTRTLVGWTKDYPRAKLSIRGWDRADLPASSGGCSWLDIMDLESGQSIPGWWEDGAGVVWPDGKDPMLPVGRYSVIGNLCTYTDREPWSVVSNTIGGDPELVLDRDREVVIDARQGKKVEFATHREATPLDHTQMKVTWRRHLRAADGIGYVQGGVLWGPEQYVVPNAHKATSGTFSVAYEQVLAEPELTMRSTGTGGRELDAWYPWSYTSPYINECYKYEKCVPTFASPGEFPVVDAKSGSPAELAAAGVRGKVALVHESWPIPCGQQYCDPPTVDRVVTDAAAAGATGVLIAAAHPGRQLRQVEARTSIPVAVLAYDDGRELAKAAKAKRTSVQTGGVFPATYVYDLSFTSADLPATPVFQAGPEQLATVTARYHADAPGLMTAVGDSRFEAPFVRTEFVSPGQRAHYVRSESPMAAETGDPDASTFELLRTTHVAGTKSTADFGATPMVPRPFANNPAVTVHRKMSDWDRDSIRMVSLQAFRSGDHEHSSGGRVSGRVLRDGVVLCERAAIAGYSCTVDPKPGRYRFEADTTQQARLLSRTTSTAWEFDVAFDEAQEVPPFIDLDHDVPLDLTNSVPVGRAYSATVLARYQPGFTGTGTFTAQAWTSSDDGATWTALGSVPVDDAGRAKFHLAAPSEPGFVTWRVRVTDAAGNSVDQTVRRAWQVTR